jgi:hypothetical protein
MAISRVFLVKHTVDKRALYIKHRIEQGQTQQEAEEKSPSHFEIMSEMTRRFLVGGAEGWDTTPTQFIIRLRNYGMAASGNEASPGSVSWDHEDAIVSLLGLGILVLNQNGITHRDCDLDSELIDDCHGEIITKG